ncbi:hypothetical protein DRP04_01725 [Archaeoglobales archaeon]|nr:MAG: hypothetical protein DRP04_01725 [Archaeoglobales archaeon]
MAEEQEPTEETKPKRKRKKKYTLPEDARALLKEIRELSQNITDMERFHTFLRSFPREMRCDEIRKFVSSYLPDDREKTVGETLSEVSHFTAMIAQQMRQTLEAIKKYYPDIYFKYTSPAVNVRAVQMTKLVITLLKYHVYKAAFSKLKFIVEHIAHIDPETREKLKEAVKFVTYNPPVGVKRKEWENLVYSDDFKKLLTLLSLTSPPSPPPDIPTRAELEETLKQQQELIRSGAIIKKLLAGFRKDRKVYNIKRWILETLPKRDMTVGEALELIESKIMPTILQKREQLIAEFVSRYPEEAHRVMAFRRPTKILKKVAPQAWRRIFAVLRFYGPLPEDELIKATKEIYGMGEEEIKKAIEEMLSAGYIVSEKGKITQAMF